METNIKYYTPQPEEFHLNFEFETNNCSTLPKDEQEWKQHKCGSVDIPIYDLTYSVPNKEKDARNNAYRVKYLDKEDIEFLGWKYVWFDKGEMDFTKDEWQTSYFIDTNRMQINKGDAVYFRGIIKNKSELKKLMIQLGIWDK